MKDYYTKQQEKYKLYGLNRKDIIALHNHLSYQREITPSVAKDSGQAEWTTGALDRFILTMLSILRQNYIHKDKLNKGEIESEIAIGMNKWYKMNNKEQHENLSLIEYLATELSKELKEDK